jgi:hypothetical protein
MSRPESRTELRAIAARQEKKECEAVGCTRRQVHKDAGGLCLFHYLIQSEGQIIQRKDKESRT